VAHVRSDLINSRSGGETPPKPAGEDACATIASAKIFDVVHGYSPAFSTTAFIFANPVRVTSKGSLAQSLRLKSSSDNTF